MPVKYLRIIAGMEQKEFADRLQLPIKTLKKWESGEERAPNYVVRLIEYYLEHEGLIEPREFMDDQGEVMIID